MQCLMFAHTIRASGAKLLLLLLLFHLLVLLGRGRRIPHPPEATDATTTKSPHILLIVNDQMRFDTLDPAVTPHLHRLAQSSTTFTRAYASTPTCTPSRASLLTGRGPWNHGVLGYTPALDCQGGYPMNLPSVLADELGYRTIVVGKNHFGTTTDSDTGQQSFVGHGYEAMKLYEGLNVPDDYNQYFQTVHPGADPLATCNLRWNDWKACPYIFPEYDHPTAWTTREALDIIDNFDFDDEEERMFLKISYHRPHSPYDPPERLFKKHLNDLSRERFVNNTSWDAQYYLSARRIPSDAWRGDPGDEAARSSRAGYLANVEFVDEGIGSVLAKLNEIGVLSDDLMIVVMSDHGDMNGDHYLWRKGYPYEASTRIPLIVRIPGGGQSAGTVSNAIVELRDVAPTIYDAVGWLEKVRERDPLMDGMSLLPILRGEVKGVRDWLDLEHSRVYTDRMHWNAIVGYHDDLLWKYIFFAYDGEEQLFSLSNDPHETYDLSTVDEWNWMVEFWRDKMVRHFEEQGRGDDWIKDGRLVLGRKSIVLGPNYPCV